MKKQLLCIGVLSLVSFTNIAYGQDFVQQKIKNESGSINLVTFKENAGLTSASVKDIFKDILKVSDKDELKLLHADLDFTSKFRDEKYQQFHKGIFVEFSGYNLHFKNGKLVSMNGEIFNTDDISTIVPSISSADAFRAAVNSVGAKKYMWENADYIANNEYKKPAGDLVLLPLQQADGSYKLTLAYRFDIYAEAPISRAYVYVDAEVGRVILSNAIMKHSAKEDAHYNARIEENKSQDNQNTISNLSPAFVAGTADTRYNGSQSIETSLSGSNYILFDTTRGNGVRTYNLKKATSFTSAVEFTDADNNWTVAEFDNSAYDNAALDAHWGVSKTYDYFKEKFNRNSYNGNGTLLKSYIHYGSNYENAGWTGSEMIYGDGATNFRPLTAFDVTAHELGHGVCSSSANLAYQRESGAINEGLSDIWGAAVEYTYAPSKQTWLIGEDIVKVNPGYLRSMSNPKSGLTKQPDTYRGTNWYPATVEEGCVTPGSSTNDNCGVHYNSGVLNHWFYILSIGKTGTNDLGKSYNVTGIGIDNAAKIAYRLETAYLTSSSNYIAARNYGLQAAIDLFGNNSPEAIATQDAFYAVGLGAKYLAIPDTTPPTIPTNLNAINTTGTQTTLQWNASTDDNDMDSYIVYKDNTEYATVASSKTSLIVTGLTPNTTYTFKVRAKDAYNNVSTDSNALNVTTLNQQIYCTSQGNSTADERIKRVQFNTIDNSSTSTAGYEDFTYISTDVTREQNYTITITPEWTGTAYSEAYAVYVDWNNDGDFSDTGETVFTKSASTTTPVVGSFTVPATAVSGDLRMRVSLRYTTIPSACGSFNYGQVEDYTLKLGTLGISDSKNAANLLYPNPVKDYLGIQSKKSGEVQYTILSVTGQVVAKGTSNAQKINTSNLVKGNYVIELKFQDGEKLTQKFIKQ